MLASPRCESWWSPAARRPAAEEGSRAAPGRVRPLPGPSAARQDQVPTESGGEKERAEDERRRVRQQVRMEQINTEAVVEIDEAC